VLVNVTLSGERAATNGTGTSLARSSHKA
jgi:hypothetical protein